MRPPENFSAACCSDQLEMYEAAMRTVDPEC